MKRRLRALAAAFTLLLFAAGAVHAQPHYGRTPAAGLFGSLWSWVASHLGSWLKADGMMDPNGLQSPAPPGSTSDAVVRSVTDRPPAAT